MFENFILKSVHWNIADRCSFLPESCSESCSSVAWQRRVVVMPLPILSPAAFSAAEQIIVAICPPFTMYLSEKGQGSKIYQILINH